MGIRGGQGFGLQRAAQPASQRIAVRRHIMPIRVSTAACIAAAILAIGGCAYKPTLPPSQGHINADQIPPNPQERILPPVTRSDFVPPPRPQVKIPTYSVVVQEVPVKELLFSLSRDTKQNIDVHPGIQGLVTMNAIDETLPAILERISQQINMRYRTEGKTIVVVPDTPYFKTYRVNYVNMNRDTTSSIGVSGDISGASTGTGGQSGGGGGGSQSSSASSTKVDTKSVNNFWDVLRQNIESILAASKQMNQNADQRAARAESERAAREERIAQAEAVSRAGANAASLFSAAFPPGSSSTDIKNDIVVNPVTGTITVLGTDKQQALVQQYLDSVGSASQRQVLIEATIAEVRLSNAFQAGVDWSRIASGTGFSFQQQLLGTNLGTPPRMVVGYTNATSDLGNIALSLRLLEQFGNTRVLSSPKLMALNNQSALLKVVDNLVYFTIESDTNTNQLTTTTTYTSTARTVPVGLIMSVLPQITEGGMVNLTVRPTISSVIRFVPDPNPALQFTGTGVPLNNPISNLIPEVQVREMESVLQAGSGQTIILGGLMQDQVKRNRDQIPGLGNIPRVGEAFQYRDEEVGKTELVIFLKPTVISNPSLDSDELKMFQRFLPVVDKTGKTP
jgi:MSHA type pilus biogenesis protein MshL